MPPFVAESQPACKHVARERRIGSLFVGAHIYPAGMTMPAHSRSGAYFGVNLQGSYQETIGGRLREGKPGTVAFHPANERHSFQIHNNVVKCLIVEMGPDWMERMGEHGSLFEQSVTFDGGRPFELAARLFDELYQSDDASTLAIEGLVLEIIAESARRIAMPLEKKPPRWLSQARKMLEEQFADPQSLDELANAVGIHPVHLSRAFREQYGTTIGEFLRQVRVQHTCEQLAGTDLPLIDIAFEAGFSDQSHFTRTFKRVTGVTPLAYRISSGRRRKGPEPQSMTGAAA
jgi:AraC family transcriptional regulator